MSGKLLIKLKIAAVLADDVLRRLLVRDLFPRVPVMNVLVMFALLLSCARLLTLAVAWLCMFGSFR